MAVSPFQPLTTTQTNATASQVLAQLNLKTFSISWNAETTARYAQELGYHVTLVRDATAAFSHEMMHAAHELNGPTFAHAILKTSELIAALPSD